MDARGAETIVIGAGAIGCAVSWRLAQAGLSVALIERGEPGREASFAAAGILGAQMEAHAAGPLFSLQLASRALHPGLAAELLELTGIDIGCRIDGVLEHAFSEAEVAELRARFDWQRAAGLRVEWLEHQLNALGALLLPQDGQVDNRLLSQALRIAAEQASVSIVRGEVRSIEERGGRVSGVKLADATGAESVLEAQNIVVAAGSWSALVAGARVSPGSVRPVRGQMIAFASPAKTSARVLACRGGYAVPRGDRVLVGATVEEAGFEKAVTPEGTRTLREIAARLIPKIAAAPIIESWSGLRPASRDGLPLLGAPASGPDGLFVCTGHYRSGILMVPISAELIRDSILGKPTSQELGPFRPDRRSLRVE